MRASCSRLASRRPQIATLFKPAASLVGTCPATVCLAGHEWTPSLLPPAGGSAAIQTRLSSSKSRWKQRQGGDRFARDAKVQGLKSRAAFKLLEMDDKYKLFKKGNVVVDLGYAPGSWSQVAVDRVGPRGRVVGIDIIPAKPPRGVSTIQGNFLSPGVQHLVHQFLRDDDRRRRAARASAAPSTSPAPSENVDEGGLEEADDNVVLDRPSYIDAERASAQDDSAAGPDASASEAESKQEKLVDVLLSDMSAPWPQTYGFSVNSLSNPYIRMMNTSGNNFRDHAGSMDLCMAALSFADATLKTGGRFVCKFYQGQEDKAFEGRLKKLFRKVHREKPESSRSESKESFFVAQHRKPGVTLQDV